MSDLVERLLKRAEIRRQIATRKSVQEGKPDRISDILEEAAARITQLEGTERLCPGCRSLDGEHDFGPTCTISPPTDDGKGDVATCDHDEGVDARGCSVCAYEDLRALVSVERARAGRAEARANDRERRMGWYVDRIARLEEALRGIVEAEHGLTPGQYRDLARDALADPEKEGT